MSQDEIFTKVSSTLVEALNGDEDQITPGATSQGDLGPEPIDFVDRVTLLFTIHDPRSTIHALMRWIWIDRFIEFRHREYARAVKLWSGAEDVFAAHFPEFPVVPAALILEGLAQTGGILVGEANDYREKVVLAKIPRAHFHGEALAGQELVYETNLVDLRGEGALVEGKVTADGERFAE